MSKKSKHGTVSTQVDNGRLRLVFTCPIQRKRKYLYLGLPDSNINRIAANQKALQIQADIASKNYDPTLTQI